MNILVVDDEKFNLIMAQDLIKENILDSQVFLCSAPETVLKKLEEYNIDIILLDIIMPNISGIDILKNIRTKKEYDDIQIIMFTGIKDKTSFKLCFENGANDYINKPIEFTEFIARINASVKARKNILSLIEMNATITKQYQKLHVITQELKETQFNLVQKEKLASLGEIAAGITHEINTPIGFISSNLATLKLYTQKIKNMIFIYRKFVQVCAKENITPEKLMQEKTIIDDIEQQEKINFVLNDLTTILSESSEGADRITKIVQSIQTLAKTGIENEMVYNDLTQIIEEGLLIVKSEAQSVAEIDRQMQDQLYLLCNKGQIGQVILNILQNAIYAIKNLNSNSLGKIIIKTYSSEDYVICQISDTGPGIKDEHLSRIFDPFFTTKDVGNGVGLGLSIAYDIVKKHGGEFYVTSEIAKGTSFTIKLPTNGSDQSHAK